MASPTPARLKQSHAGETTEPRGGNALSLPTPDWLRHDLYVSGPAAEVENFQTVAAGSGGIPWVYPDLALEEEDRMHALLHPPDGSPGLSLHGARTLARLLRNVSEIHQARVVAAVGQSRACPFDLHALVPIPKNVLERGPDDPGSQAWLRQHWGSTRALRHVVLHTTKNDRRLRRSAKLHYSFYAADWTPWAAFVAVRTRWPKLVFEVRPDYRRD
jgi:hypothetical protein